MISYFDVYDYLPRTDCGKCLEGSCIKMAQAISQGKRGATDCTIVSKDVDSYKDLFDLINEEE